MRTQILAGVLSVSVLGLAACGGGGDLVSNCVEASLANEEGITREMAQTRCECVAEEMAENVSANGRALMAEFFAEAVDNPNAAPPVAEMSPEDIAAFGLIMGQCTAAATP